MNKKTTIFLISILMMSILSSGVFAYGGWFKPKYKKYDWDFIPYNSDNCPKKFNPSQRDSDNDGIGNACDDNSIDVDWDGINNSVDNCVWNYNPSQRDADNDSKGDMCDKNKKDLDWDGIKNSKDNCMLEYNPSQVDSDGDRRGDYCDCRFYFFTRYCG